MQKLTIKHTKLFALSFLTAAAVGAALWLLLMPQNAKEEIHASLGNPEAQYLLAKRLAGGSGVPEDDKAAVGWFRKAAEQNHVKSCMIMARLYFTGDGVERSDTEGAKWLQRAAENGSSFAQAMMGLLYTGGIGVEQNAEQAVGWLSMSQELEADMLMQDLRRNLERINALPQDDQEKALDTFYARRKLYTGELFTKLMRKMQQQENKGDDDGN